MYVYCTNDIQINTTIDINKNLSIYHKRNRDREKQKINQAVNNSRTHSDCQTSDKMFAVLFN